MIETTLDLRGLKCPLPVLRTRKALAALPAGATILVECTDPWAAIDLPHLIKKTGNILLARDVRDDGLTFLIRKSIRPEP